MDFVCKVSPFIMLFMMIFILKKLTEISVAENFTNCTAQPCEMRKDSCAPCGGTPEGQCVNFPTAGWNNSVSADLSGPRWPGGDPDGRCRIFKRKNYYGWGACNSYSYGEPFYERCVKY